MTFSSQAEQFPQFDQLITFVKVYVPRGTSPLSSLDLVEEDDDVEEVWWKVVG